MIKDLKMRKLSWIFQVGPKSHDKCSYKRQKWGRPCEDGSRDWRKAAISQGIPRIASSKGEVRNNPALVAQW